MSMTVRKNQRNKLKYFLSLSDCNWIRSHNQLVHKRPLSHLAKLAYLAKWLSDRLRTKCLWVQIPLLPLKIFLFG